MESYTIEDIEVIRQKSNLSYQEAVALLDYHNGNLARALIDLERNGRLTEDKTNQSTRSTADTPKEGGILGLLGRLFRFRLKISKGNAPIVNLSVLFCILSLIIAPHLAVISGILALLLGYNFAFDKNDSTFAHEDFGKMVRNAGENAKNSVNNVVRSFPYGQHAEDQSKGNAESTKPVQYTQPVQPVQPVQYAQPVQPAVANPVNAVNSYFAGNPATAHGTVFSSSGVPTIQIPVQVESKEGDVTIDQSEGGYSSVTVD